MASAPFPYDFHRAEPLDNSRPGTPIEALLLAGREEPEVSIAELLPLREILADAIDSLSEREKFVIEANLIEKASLRTIAKRLGLAYTTIHHIKGRALKKLRKRLESVDEIQDYLNRG